TMSSRECAICHQWSTMVRSLPNLKMVERRTEWLKRLNLSWQDEEVREAEFRAIQEQGTRRVFWCFRHFTNSNDPYPIDLRLTPNEQVPPLDDARRGDTQDVLPMPARIKRKEEDKNPTGT
ncbi:hypothetical protein PFISCL1PPCAC_21478, partial [Pristionchus fissidentatus]